ncbi:YtoQ family protein [Bacteroidota bacterium]
MKYKIFLSGEIHSNWRNELIKASTQAGLPVEFEHPELNHEKSDNCGPNILGGEKDNFWADHKSAKINSIRVRNGIKKADIVVVKFGEQYKQWNAAFDAGFAAALGKSLILIHPKEFTHALKEVDGAAHAVAETIDQVIEILKYICRE